MENKMIYGMNMNIHQRDAHTIQVYILDVKQGDHPYHVTTIEHSSKRDTKTKSNGEPYARVHDNLFNVLKSQLVKVGKWEEEQ
ncbi:hypothetical protein [Halobacillus sp. BBL2006]|uniref:hypothetical protein n=1 Tax=Halobacillus sp. BBL2006 TaxID=1543706 RepID=UPI000542BA1D|nr:hypothetical protein [Halobacillus sp. BBL2006]KHE67697.1 hypothetical protein LD39_16395 [Halobacillus sp. BBL2006]